MLGSITGAAGTVQGTVLGSCGALAVTPWNPDSPASSAKACMPRVVMSAQLERVSRRRAIAPLEDEDGLDRFYRRSFEERVPTALAPTAAIGPTASFMDRLAVAWNMLFPSNQKSVAQIAKMRLRLVLNSDRMQVSPHLKHQLCSNVVNTMSEFVIVNKDAEVQFAVHRSPDTGSVYMIKVPVQRVKPQLQLQMQPVVEAMERRR